jgi:hypothetical protein
VGEIVDGQIYSQRMTSPCDVIESVNIMTGSYDRENTGSLQITALNEEGSVLAEARMPVSAFVNNEYSTVSFDAPIETDEGEQIIFEVRSQECTPGNTITIYI